MKNNKIFDFDFLVHNDLISLKNPKNIIGGHPIAVGIASHLVC